MSETTKTKKTKAKTPIDKQVLEVEKSKQLAESIGRLLVDKKALNVIGIKIDHLTVLADYFIIASAKSTTAVRALANAVDEMTSKTMGIEVRRQEGIREGRWVAMDFNSVILHIFLEETREFYQLERLWVDGLNTITFE